MLPAAFCEPGWSSRSISERTRFSRAPLAARTISVLLRGSAMTVVRNDVSAWPWPAATAGAVLPPPESDRRCTTGARSEASACLSGITSTSVALDTSSAAMMRADALQVVGVVGDHQRVVAGVDVDRVVGADQRAQDGHQVGGGLVVQPEDLRDDLAAGGARRPDRHRAALQLGVGFGHHLEQAARLHHCEARQAQRRQELVVGLLRRRPGGRSTG